MYGTIDGIHISLRNMPKLGVVPAIYQNRHDDQSVLLQVLSDYELNFWKVVLLALGGKHYATHLRAFSLYRGFTNPDIIQESRAIIINKIVLPYIDGNLAYPSLINIMKAYS